MMKLLVPLLFCLCLGTPALAAPPDARSAALPAHRVPLYLNVVEQVYAIQFSDHGRKLNGLFARIMSLFRSPQVGSADWKRQVTAALKEMQVVAQESQRLVAPPSLRHAQGLNALGMRQVEAVTRRMPAAVQSLDETALARDLDALKQGADSISQADAVIRQLELHNKVNEYIRFRKHQHSEEERK